VKGKELMNEDRNEFQDCPSAADEPGQIFPSGFGPGLVVGMLLGLVILLPWVLEKLQQGPTIP
jgi:hypothetical protein